MTIQPLAALPQSVAAGSTAQTTPASSSSSSADAVSQTEFMQLLVAQIQNQDPTNPTDSTAFVTQLAQFSSLEQLVGIHTDLNSLTQSGTQSTTSTQGAN